ncbi:thioredoxin reductase 3 [Paramuricea clavata]|uniref:thioredoxin-disulfide reductase (NADPH) n=1 Tax=Paramuricea clavata TaxID=317549 RepID=A0A6S7FSE4_PARCT|nr:thioredoxin reductase 3 [Paramuricea clavata]
MAASSSTSGRIDELEAKALFQSLGITIHLLDIDIMETGAAIKATLLEMTGQKTVPNVFIRGKHIGGWDATNKLNEAGKLMPLINPPTEKYDYDLVVIGGGSGGLSCSKESSKYGVKVAVLDFIKPTPSGTTWGLGGTCVNVGCIPKKLMHQAALLGGAIKDSAKFGWELDQDKVKHNWQTMKEAIQNYIGSLNWGYRVALRDKGVKYLNAHGELIDAHKIKTTNNRGKVTEITAETIVLATGERPRYPDIPGAKEFAITSDDLFSLPYCPGKTLVVGASYVALECAGFLAGIGLDVTVMVRSIFLRGFDQQMAEIVGSYMEKENVKIIKKHIPTKIEMVEDGQPKKLKVHYKSVEGGEEFQGEYNTVLFAIGRDSCTEGIGLENVGVALNPKNHKVIVDDKEQTNVSNIYALGDILEGRLELTPVAIEAGMLLAQRLYAGSNTLCDYVNVPTTVFTPLEYSCCGYAEEDAIAKFGEDNLEMFHTNLWPLEWTVAEKDNNICYAKLICNKQDQNRIVGLHITSPNAGEVMQGFACAIKCGATKADFDRTIGIHPTIAEVFTTMDITKGSGQDITQTGC